MASCRSTRAAALFAVAAFLTAPSFGQTAVLRIDEPQIKFRLSAHPAVEIPIVNTSDKPLPGDFKLELLATDDRVERVVTGAFQGSPGTTVEKIAWPQDSLARISPLEFGWRRLRYSFTPRPESGVGAAQGIVQLSRVLAGIFQVRLAGASRAEPGSRYPVRVRVDDPVTGKPRRGAAVDLTLTLDDDDDTTFKHAVVTDLAGYAVYTFDLPKETKAQQGTVTAEATRAGFSEQAELQFDMRVTNKVTLTTDKPLYQPGQIAHLRVLALGPDRRALANREVEISVKDEEDNEQLVETVKTSRFGIASADWNIPLKLRLGDYQGAAKLRRAGDDYDSGWAVLRVSRYELPTFTVKAEPDRKYYLPGQDARIVITADYLFGKPVQNATVRLVRQQERRWNFKEQKWETGESNPIEGAFDKQGRFEANVDLGDDFARFDPEGQSHYEDLTFAAYVTDLPTKRTEQRRFRIRLSQQPVQLYIISGGQWSPANQPATLYVTSSYADGQPASVNGTLYFAEPKERGGFENLPWQGGRSKALNFHTNRFGVGKIALPRIRERFLVKPREQYGYYNYRWKGDDSYRHALLLFEASDAKGSRGRASETWPVSPEAHYLRVTTPRTLYRPGESLAVSVESNSPVREVIVNISSPAGLLSSKVVPLGGGTADVTFDYDARFRGEVEISAFALTRSDDDAEQALSAAAHVIYPAPQDLQVRLNMARTTYRPGETASADFKVRSPHGAGIESALGILVFDRAVAERVRSDEEFGPYGFSIYDYLDERNTGSIAGIGVRNLVALDPNQPFGADLQLLAEALMYSEQGYWWSGDVRLSSGEDYTREAESVYSPLIAKSLEPVRKALDDTYAKEGRYPKNDAQLTAFLTARSVVLASIHDPWGRPYRTRFSVSGTFDVLTFESDGPDKLPGTRDDVELNFISRPYFEATGQLIDRIVYAYPQRTGKYIRDYATLRQEMKAKGVDPDAQLDPWGHRYRFGFDVAGPDFRVTVTSAGPDGVFDSPSAPSWDDVQEHISSVRYFVAESADLQRALGEDYARSKRFPQNEEELKPILTAARLTGELLLDPWGRPYHISFSKRSVYNDRVNISTSHDYATAKEKRVTDVVPVTQKLAFLAISSYGPENKPEQSFNVAEFSQVLTEQVVTGLAGKAPATAQGPLPSGSGAITGVVTDASGAVVPNTEVTATSLSSGQSATTRTDSSGVYVLSGIPAGIYEVKALAQGFRVWEAINVPVQMGSTTRLDAMLSVGELTEHVVVEAQSLNVQAETNEVSSVVGKGLQGTAPVEKPLFTPRLRKYFPETLLWKPELVTNARGQAHIDFPMADNITAWSMSVIASTGAGQVGVAQKELRTFQPFFLEHDPPKVLTQGDRISLPVVLRNYSERQQTVLTELKPESWFSILPPAAQKVTVEPGGDARAVFTFKADARANPGKQRVTASNADTGDAVEREIQVHPDGQEISFTTGRVLAGEDRTLEIPIPQTAIAGSIDAEVRIYPNLIAHVLDAMNGIGRKPAGCAEQITSIAYVSLEALQLLKKAGIEKAGPGDPRKQVLADARKAVQDGFEMLRTLQKPSGGFGYWNNTSENLALTAYVLRFLTDADEFIDVDADAIARARAYLVAQQSPTGAWQRYDDSTKKQIDDPMDTAYIARALAASGTKLDKSVEDCVKKALSYIDDRIAEWSSPYLIGNYAIAAASIKHETHIANARAMLARLAHQEGPATYWNLEANTTPFYGWGYAGRLETTALAVEALARLQTLSRNPAEEEQLNRGLQYLLTHKDRYSIWYSTQATQNVLEALISGMPPEKAGAADASATILVNGTKLASIQLPKPDQVSGPKVIEFGKELAPGSNRVEIERTGAGAALQANAIASYYVPWAASEAAREEGVKTGDTRALRLKVAFDRRETGIGEAVTCRVEAERIGFRGYGMMIAEVGLPPGAEVDRESLEKARGAGVDGYEVQPDRVVFYLWPSAGGSAFEFAFRLRFAMDALSAPSLLYDYYNPEANAAVLPVRFSVH
jgi:hypothetical protein